MKQLKNLKIFFQLIILSVFLVGCSYTQSALDYAKEGTQRVEAGYASKLEMTKAIVEHLAIANKDCGVKVEIVNNIPITTVKECVRFQDAMAVVESTPIIAPQQVSDIADGIGDFVMKSTNLVVPLAGIYYGAHIQEKTLDYNYKTNVDNNQYQAGVWENYTGSYKNSTNTNSIEVVTQDKIQVVEQDKVQVVNQNTTTNTNNTTPVVYAPVGTIEAIK